ncbi:energy coupling factor transporter S component ThiW [Cellulosilyticum sp. I15G10I2]|uniref:energy coupling factor transporter S component ThiW n=1 Tax=Cellulosilyticum sp. I15G10I2 TaxID=1892843 RepID=UPI00085BD632|nr:energy coupling factor transporter S component ThiW [Cellulosilyticum sp. I15G10I2]
MNSKVKKICLAGILIALAVTSSTFYIPIGAAKCFPIQHLINVLTAVLLGPWYGVGVAFCTSIIRVMLGTGTLLAFPGSMFGALLAGLLFLKSKKLVFAFVGELVGTGIIGALAAYPIAVLLMGRQAALFGFIIPFGISSAVGGVVAIIIISIMDRTKVIKVLRKENGI